MGNAGTPEPTTEREPPETDPEVKDSGESAEGPADPEGSSGAEEGLNPWAPESYDAVRVFGGGLVRPLQVCDDDTCALRGETTRDRGADALRGARDDGDLAVERAVHRIGENDVGTRIRFCCV